MLKSKQKKKKKRTSDLDKFMLSHEIANEKSLEKFSKEKFVILQNEIRCNKCGDQIFSASVHDFNTCKCMSVAVDGGQEYLKRSGTGKDYTELSICIKRETLEKCLHIMFTSLFQRPKNLLGVLCAIMRTLRDCGEKV